MDEFIALCPRPSPDELSERIAGEDDDGQEVAAAWRYTIRPNAIFVTDTSDEPNIVWSSSATFPRTDRAEVEARIRSRPVQFTIYLEESRRPDAFAEGTLRRNVAALAGKEQGGGAEVQELERNEFRRARVVRFDPASAVMEEEVLTAD
jgi:hypothetical protein